MVGELRKYRAILLTSLDGRNWLRSHELMFTRLLFTHFRS